MPRNALQVFGLKLYELVVDVRKPVQTQLLQLSQPVHAGGHFSDHIVVKKQDL